MRETYRQISERDVFTLTIEELEEGERPGWLKRARIVIDGEYATMEFDVQWNISKWGARWEIIKMRYIALRKRLWPLR